MVVLICFQFVGCVLNHYPISHSYLEFICFLVFPQMKANTARVRVHHSVAKNARIRKKGPKWEFIPTFSKFIEILYTNDQSFDRETARQPDEEHGNNFYCVRTKYRSSLLKYWYRT